MLIAYVDESFDSENYRISGLVVSEGRIRVLSDALDAVVKAAAAAHGLDERAELHGHELYHAKGDWKSLGAMPRARIGIYRDALRAIAAHSEALYVRGVRRHRFRERYAQQGFHEHTAVLTMLMESLDEHAAMQGEVMMVVADECDVEQLAHDELWWSQRYGTWGYKSRVIRQIVDTVHFVPSRASRLVQAVDMVAFLHRRISDVVEGDKRAARANEALWSEVAHRVALDKMWHP